MRSILLTILLAIILSACKGIHEEKDGSTLNSNTRDLTFFLHRLRTPEIASLIAPRALHLNFGELDEGSPIESVKQGLKRITEVYQKKGVPENFTFFIEPGSGHVLSEAMWQHVKACFARNLKE